MKHLLTPLLFLIGLTGLAQPTYLDLFIQFDQYPQETAWVITQGTDTIPLITSPDYGLPEYINGTTEQRLFLQAGVDYTFTILDVYGDGICCEFGEGFFISANNCEGVIFEDSTFGSSEVSYTFNLLPCEVPTTDVMFRVNLANAPPEIETPGVLGNWNGWQVIPMEYDEDDEWFVTIPIQAGNYLWKFADVNNPDLQELPVGIEGGSCFQLDQFGFINRTLTVIEEEETVLPNYCWESCLPCGAIPGCTNFNAINWNPWSNFDDGSCIDQTTECALGETLVEVIVTPDQWGGEISWILYGDFGDVASAPVGTYAGSSPGIPVTTGVCVPIAQPYDIVIQDSYGDGIIGVNGQPGNIQILDCEGEVLYNLQDEHPDGNFGYITGSDQFTPTVCEGIDDLVGCTDPNYVEYNPEAVIDNPLESFCVTPIVLGCLDPTQFNYNPDANTEDVIQFCDYTLTITDGVGDGWFGSWVGIYQQWYFSPQYQMGPNDGTELSFNVSGLDASKKAYIYFFISPQSISTIQQCGFTLTNPEGDIIIDVPFFSAIPFTGESGWYTYEIDLYCGNTCEELIFGCQSPIALNYNDEANIDDGSCYYEPGCTQAGYLEYYTQGFEADFDNGDCQTLAVFGCTDNNAFNFDEGANVDNETCVDKILGCTNELAFNYDPLANTDDNSCVPIIEGCTNPEALNYTLEANTEDFSCILPILGCTDPTAFNYNPLANTDDNSCVEVVFGCTDETAFNYDPLANTNVGCESIVEGCTDIEAFNFNVSANVNDGSCESIVFGCTDETAFNYDENANTNVGCESVVEGCTDEEAINYNPQANTDNDTCEAEIFGCTDPTAFNYDELANTDNGSCEAIVFGCLDETALNYTPDANTDNGSCEEIVEGCMDPLALNYNELANVEDGSCIDAIYGCTDPNAFNYNELANTDNGTCEDVVEGCTDPTAFNYNPNANTEDFSCIEVVYGCTEEYAVNYNPEANVDSGDCEAVYTGCMEQDEYLSLNLIDPAFAWVISVSPSCCPQDGGVGWTDGCQELHDYWLNNNEVTNIEEYGETQIIVFPNPTRDRVNIVSNLHINAVLYNSIGQPVLQETDVNQLDLSKFEAGIYNLILTHNNLQFTKKIIKQ